MHSAVHVGAYTEIVDANVIKKKVNTIEATGICAWLIHRIFMY